jgi:hypothetical protein
MQTASAACRTIPVYVGRYRIPDGLTSYEDSERRAHRDLPHMSAEALACEQWNVRCAFAAAQGRGLWCRPLAVMGWHTVEAWLTGRLAAIDAECRRRSGRPS